MWIGFLGWEDPPEEGTEVHSSILAGRIPWTEEPGGYSPWGHKETQLSDYFFNTDLDISFNIPFSEPFKSRMKTSCHFTLNTSMSIS